MCDWASEVVATDSWPAVEAEQMGRRAKSWLRSPHDGSLWLFKHTRVAGDGRPHGEDWAEVLAAAVAQRMGLPHAEVRLATRRGGDGTERGIIVRHFSTEPDDHGSHRSVGRLQHGNELLAGQRINYELEGTGTIDGYTVENALEVLRPYDCHPSVRGTPIVNAAVQLVAYLAFDALINATDRHHENWAVLTGPNGSYLVETYDHGACLGVPTPEHIRQRRLDGHDGGVAAWLERGRTRFEDRPTPVAVARAGLAALDAVTDDPDTARSHIRERLEAVTDEWFQSAASRVPERLLSHPARTFAQEIVRMTREELLND